MDSNLDSGLLAISLSDSEDSSASSKPKEAKTRAEKTAQTEADFQTIKASYSPRVENGEIWKAIKLPLSPSPHKLQLHDIIYAVEELYFYRRYDEGLAFARKVLDSEAETGSLDRDTFNLLNTYVEKFSGKLAKPTDTR